MGRGFKERERLIKLGLTVPPPSKGRDDTYGKIKNSRPPSNTTHKQQLDIFFPPLPPPPKAGPVPASSAMWRDRSLMEHRFDKRPAYRELLKKTFTRLCKKADDTVRSDKH